jgi:hypothetical protein
VAIAAKFNIELFGIKKALKVIDLPAAVSNSDRASSRF